MGLAAALPGSPDGGLSMRTGTVTAISAGVISVDIGGGTLLAASYLDSYFPALGDVVQLIGASGAWLIIGRCGTTPGQLSIRDADTGLSQVEMGLLDDGTYGLAAVNASGQLVDLSTMAFGPATDVVSTTQTTSSTGFVDLTTVGPRVTPTIGQSGRAMVVLSAKMTNTSTNGAMMGFAVTGATTVSATSSKALLFDCQGTGTWTVRASAVFLASGLNAGANTFTSKYAALSGTASFSDREIAVFPY